MENIHVWDFPQNMIAYYWEEFMKELPDLSQY